MDSSITIVRFSRLTYFEHRAGRHQRKEGMAIILRPRDELADHFPAVKTGQIHLHRAFEITERHTGEHITHLRKEVGILYNPLDDADPDIEYNVPNDEVSLSQKICILGLL